MNRITYQLEGAKAALSADNGSYLLQACSDGIVRCIYSPKEPNPNYSALGISPPQTSKCVWKAAETADTLSLQAGSIQLDIGLSSGHFLWRDAATGKELLQEGNKELTSVPVVKYSTGGEAPKIRRVKTVDGERNFIENLKPYTDREAYRGKIFFQWRHDEQLHGLGQAEEGIYNYRGQTQYLYQHNMRTPIPFLISDQSYGILFDCGSLMTFNDDARGSYMFFDTVEQLDYYFIHGSTLDDIIKGYRTLTGNAPLLPKWAYGYIQSKEAYRTQEELVATAAEYRKKGIPLDCIVQDWNTWEPGKWGNKHLDLSRYPNIREANRQLHEMHVHSMVSIWPNMNMGCADINEFLEENLLLGDASTYDAFQEKARDLYWRQADAELFQGGFDSWWCDSTEPFSGPDWGGETLREPWERYSLVGGEHKKYLDPACANLFALKHAQGIFEHQKKQAPEKRVVNLTRSGYAGSQQYGTILWSGDISANWDTLRRQITEGLNFCMSGLPYWTLDIGGFFVVGTDYTKRGCGCNDNPNPLWFWSGHYNGGCEDLGYRELYTRWLEYGVFLPIFRSHGTDTPREIWNFGEPGSPFYDAIEKFIRLRYRLLPYIYSLAASVTFRQDTVLRSLLFDFAEDTAARQVSDEFMFGRSLLVCPVYQPMYYDAGSVPLEKERKRTCYLPSGCTWYDFWTNEPYDGGQSITVDAPLDKIPVFVRSGSLIPMETEKLEYVDQISAAPFEIHIYPGQDAQFLFYEDSGDGYAYEQGDYSIIPLKWEDASSIFSIGEAPNAEFPQSIRGREIRLILHCSQPKTISFTYTGSSQSFCFASLMS